MSWVMVMLLVLILWAGQTPLRCCPMLLLTCSLRVCSVWALVAAVGLSVFVIHSCCSCCSCRFLVILVGFIDTLEEKRNSCYAVLSFLLGVVTEKVGECCFGRIDFVPIICHAVGFGIVFCWSLVVLEVVYGMMYLYSNMTHIFVDVVAIGVAAFALYFLAVCEFSAVVVIVSVVPAVRACATLKLVDDRLHVVCDDGLNAI
jgi:hypothetical protein